MRLLSWEDPIKRLCRLSGQWRVSRHDAEEYAVHRIDHHLPRQLVQIRYREGISSVLFQSWLSIRFPLDRPPSGLYGRLLLRNFELLYGSWCMDIDHSVEASLSVWARVDKAALTPRLFDTVCAEAADEVQAFHQELRDKFRGDMGRPAQGRVPAETGVRFIEPQDESPSLQHHARYRLPGR